GFASQLAFSLAFWSHTLQPSARKSAALRAPRKKPTSSPTADLKASFLVVTAGKPCCRSKRRDAPGSDSVRMPVRFSCHEPWSRMDWISERYCFMSVRAGGPAGGAAASGGRRGLRVDDIDREAQLRGFFEHGRG